MNSWLPWPQPSSEMFFFVWDLNLSDQQAKIIDKLSLVQDNLTAIRQVVLTSEVSNTILPPQIVLEKRPSQHHVRQNSLSIVSHRQKLFFWRPLSLGKPSVIDYTSLSTHRGFVNCEAPWRWWVVPSLWPDLGHCLFAPFTCFYWSWTIPHQGCDLQRTLSDCPLQSVTQSRPLRSYLACPPA